MISSLLRQPWDGRYRKREWFKPLSRVLLPLRDAVNAIEGDRDSAEAAVGGILRETLQREQTLWSWSHSTWVGLLGSQAFLFKRAKGHRPDWRTGYMAIAYLLRCLGEIRDYGPVKVTHLAHRVFGEQDVKEAESLVLDLLRLPVGAITWGPFKKEGGDGQRVCFLQVPLGKTNVSFVNPVDSIVGEAIECWEKVRPVQPNQLDEKSANKVDFLLATRTRRLNRRYLNRSLIGALCRKAGVPRTDARGLITSHRARTTIASQLYNAKEPLTLFELQAWLGHRSPVSTQFYANIRPTKLAKAFGDAGYFERNLRAIDVLIDQAAVRQGLSEKEPWKYYDLGHGYCTYDFFDQCAHRMACARCSFYLPKESSAASLLEGKTNLLRLRQRIPLLEAEVAAIDDGFQCFDALLRGLEAVPTPAGQTPSELQSDLIQITQTKRRRGDR